MRRRTEAINNLRQCAPSRRQGFKSFGQRGRRKFADTRAWQPPFGVEERRHVKGWLFEYSSGFPFCVHQHVAHTQIAGLQPRAHLVGGHSLVQKNKMKVKRKIEVVMLTGGNAATTKRIAADLGIDNELADMLPGHKTKKTNRKRRVLERVGHDR